MDIVALHSRWYTGSMFKKVFILFFAWVLGSCSSSDGGDVFSVELNGDGGRFSVPARGAKYDVNLTASSALVEIVVDQNVRVMTLNGNSNLITVRVGTNIEKIRFLGSSNKVVAPFKFQYTVEDSGSGNVVEQCLEGSKPEAHGNCVPCSRTLRDCFAD